MNAPPAPRTLAREIASATVPLAAAPTRGLQIRGIGHQPAAHALARFEVIALLGTFALLLVVALPVLAGNRLRADRVVCANNLRQIATAMQVWAGEHGDRFPQEVLVADGGTMGHPLSPNVWLHFSWISNELSSPRTLFCPSDQGKPARDFSADPAGGYLHPNSRNKATSYLLSHTFTFQPTSLLAGDRNVGSDGAGSCSRFNSALYAGLRPVSTNLEWTAALHEGGGNLLLFDGRVVEVPTRGLRAYCSRPQLDEIGNLHFISPR
jgi:hypothetical protein